MATLGNIEKRVLQRVIMNGSSYTDQTMIVKETIAIAVCHDFLLDQMVEPLSRLIQSASRLEDGFECDVTSFVLPSDVDRSDFEGCQHLLLCDDITEWKDDQSQRKKIQRLCHCMKSAFRVQANVCIGLIGDPSDFRRQLTALCQDYPEFRWLVCSGRIINIQIKDGRWTIDEPCKESLLSWLTVTESCFEPQQLLDYKDMYQILVRDLKEWVPEFDTVLRIFLLCASGILGVIFTTIILVVLSHEPTEEQTLRVSRNHVRHMILRQRMGKCEWEPGDDATSLLALQLHQSDWCFQSVENQRSLDRMEVHLLAALSRARHPSSRELTPTRLAQYINALLVLYQNPHDFHGHDLVTLLESSLQHRRASQQGVFSVSLAVIALYNSKVELDWSHIAGLLKQQKADGRFGYGIDETALATMALACVHQETEVETALEKSITWLLSHRSPEGAYGHIYSTALMLQAINVTNTPLPDSMWHETMNWLLKRSMKDSSIRNLEIASQILLVVSGKSLLSVRNFTGLGSSSDPSSHRTPRLLPHIYVSLSEDIHAKPHQSISTSDEQNHEPKHGEDTHEEDDISEPDEVLHDFGEEGDSVDVGGATDEHGDVDDNGDSEGNGDGGGGDDDDDDDDDISSSSDNHATASEGNGS